MLVASFCSITANFLHGTGDAFPHIDKDFDRRKLVLKTAIETKNRDVLFGIVENGTNIGDRQKSLINTGDRREALIALEGVSPDEAHRLLRILAEANRPEAFESTYEADLSKAEFKRLLISYLTPTLGLDVSGELSKPVNMYLPEILSEAAVAKIIDQARSKLAERERWKTKGSASNQTFNGGHSGFAPDNKDGKCDSIMNDVRSNDSPENANIKSATHRMFQTLPSRIALCGVILAFSGLIWLFFVKRKS